MNKSELVEAVAERSGLGKGDAEKAVNALTESVVDAVRSGEKVAILGFGTFNPKSRSARTGRNPRTGEPVKIAASKTVGFTVGAGFKDALNKGGKKAAAKKSAAKKSAGKAAAKKSAKKAAKKTTKRR